MSERLRQYCLDLAEQGKKALVCYCVAGDYRTSVTVPLMHGLSDGGADIIELGFPFTDPMAEGPVIQAAHARALADGTTSLRSVLDMVAAFRKENQRTPLVLMGYTNPLEQYGFDKFAADAQASGADAVLLVDMPFELAHAYQPLLAKHDLTSISLVAPTTSQARLERVCEEARGFLYYIGLRGVTGAGNLSADEVAQALSATKKRAQAPVYAGFGIKTLDQMEAMARLADGAVLGTVVVDKIADMAVDDIGAPQARKAMAAFIKPWRARLDILSVKAQ